MLSALRRQLGSQFVRQCRLMTTQSSSMSASVTSSHPYFVPRSSEGNLPVYSDIRNAGTRHLVLIRNVEGKIEALAQELSSSLFPVDSREARKMKITIKFSKHIVISGGRWKMEVSNWLRAKGF